MLTMLTLQSEECWEKKHLEYFCEELEKHDHKDPKLKKIGWICTIFFHTFFHGLHLHLTVMHMEYYHDYCDKATLCR